MSRKSHPGKTHFGAAAYVALAVLFCLRCSVAWAAADLPSRASFESTHGGARSRAAALEAVRPAPARCEAVNDDPPAPSRDRPIFLSWPVQAAPPKDQSASRCISAPAPLPPVRGPPVRTA